MSRRGYQHGEQLLARPRASRRVTLTGWRQTGRWTAGSRWAADAAARGGFIMGDVTEGQLEDMEALFVQTASSMTSDAKSITLRGLSPSTLYFADRPQRRSV